MNNLIIRNAEVKDASEVINYLNQVGRETDNLLFGEEGISYTVEQERKLISDMNSSERSRLIVALSGERIIGIASLQGFGRARLSHRGEMAISVLREYWGSGVGSGLMRELISFARSVHIEIITLEVRSDNTRAIKLYEKFGFRKFGTFEKFFKIRGEYFDADYMNLYLHD